MFHRFLLATAVAALLASAAANGTPSVEAGQPGGRLMVALRSDPKTFNPVMLVDAITREALKPLFADLVHINRATQEPEAALAKSWSVSPDGKTIDVELRSGLRFSDGTPLTADDVVFSYTMYTDARNASPSRDLLIVGGRPIAVRALGPLNVRFELAEPYAVGPRLFDSFAILPRHALEDSFLKGTFAQAWTVSTSVTQIVGSGPFRLKAYVPGQQLVYERNPHYWKTDEAGVRLPYLNELVLATVPSEETQLLQFNSGALDVLNRLSPEHFDAIGARAAGRARLSDAGAGLEYNFLCFNLNDGPDGRPVAGSRPWFREERFRKAVSLAVDRDALVRLAYRGRGTPIWGPVTPGNRRWRNESLQPHARSIADAKRLLTAAGFVSDAKGVLRDRHGAAVTFTVAVATSNAARSRMAALVVDDLKQLGMQVTTVPLEFRALVDRLYQTHDYDAAIVGFASGDADPNSDVNVWLSSGASHLWRLRGEPEPWQRDIDQRLRRQFGALQFAERKRLYDEVQQLIADHTPVVFLASPNILVAADAELGNFQPAVLEPYTLWNVDRLFWRSPGRRSR